MCLGYVSPFLKRQEDEHQEVPAGVADDIQEGRAEGEVEPAPEEGADRRGDDEHQVAAGEMDSGVEHDREDEADPRPRGAAGLLLKESPPEKLLAGPDDQAQEKRDP